jgi:hypothetical protein
MGESGGVFFFNLSLSEHSNLQQEQQLLFNLKWKYPKAPPIIVPNATIILVMAMGSVIY